jgi:hypothetical protein
MSDAKTSFFYVTLGCRRRLTPRAASSAFGVSGRTAWSANSAWPVRAISTRPTKSCSAFGPTSTAVSPTPRAIPRKPWRPASNDLDHICCFIHERIVSNDNVVQWEGRRFQIPPQPRRFSFAGARVKLYENLSGKVAVYYGETRLQLREG